MKKRITQVLAMLLAVAMLVSSLTMTTIANQGENRGQIPTSGGNRSTVWTEISLNGSYRIYGLTARELLGRDSASLTDYANAMEALGLAGTDVIIFPVNFFVAGSSEIVGGIVSQGEVVSAGPQPWFDAGVGFDTNNQMRFFHGELQNNRLVDFHTKEPMDHIVTAFNIFPRFVEDGEAHPITPRPGLSQGFINQSATRGFMGQRADGTLVVGNVSGASLPQVQDVAVYLDLVNATNLDGGASAGIWRNGSYITRPGRTLPSVIYITNTGTVTPQYPPGSTPFFDVYSGAWYYDAVRHVFENGLMNGITDTRFEPQTNLSRAMVATIIWRMAGEPATAYRPIFTDVPAGRWYSVPVTWAYDMGIVQGVGADRFAPEGMILREALATMMHRFALSRGDNTDVPSHFTLPGQVSDWAKEPVRWAAYNEFLVELIYLRAAASRAETAHFVHQFTLR